MNNSAVKAWNCSRFQYHIMRLIGFGNEIFRFVGDAPYTPAIGDGKYSKEIKIHNIMCIGIILYTYKNQIKTWPSHMIGLFRIPFEWKKYKYNLNVLRLHNEAHCLDTIFVCNRGKSGSGARENYYHYIVYYVCLLIVWGQKKHTHLLTRTNTWCPVNCFRIHVFYNRTKTRN